MKSKFSEGEQSANASAKTVVFSGRMPPNLIKGLRVVAAKTGRKQQEIVAIALQEWFEGNGYSVEIDDPIAN